MDTADKIALASAILALIGLMITILFYIHNLIKNTKFNEFENKKNFLFLERQKIEEFNKKFLDYLFNFMKNIKNIDFKDFNQEEVSKFLSKIGDFYIDIPNFFILFENDISPIKSLIDRDNKLMNSLNENTKLIIEKLDKFKKSSYEIEDFLKTWPIYKDFIIEIAIYIDTWFLFVDREYKIVLDKIFKKTSKDDYQKFDLVFRNAKQEFEQNLIGLDEITKEIRLKTLDNYEKYKDIIG